MQILGQTLRVRTVSAGLDHTSGDVVLGDFLVPFVCTTVEFRREINTTALALSVPDSPDLPVLKYGGENARKRAQSMD